MKRSAIRQLLMNQTRRLPNREKCRNFSEYELKKLSVLKLDYFQIEEFLKRNSLYLKKSDLTKAVWFKIVLFFVLQTMWSGQTPIYYPDDKIWDMSDPKTAEKVAQIKRILGHSGDLATVKLADFLAYAKSDKPDF